MLFEGMHPVAYVAVRAAMLEKSIGHYAARRYAEKRKAGVLYWLAASLQTGDQTKFDHYQMLRSNHGSIESNGLVDVDDCSNTGRVRVRGDEAHGGLVPGRSKTLAPPSTISIAGLLRMRSA